MVRPVRGRSSPHKEPAPESAGEHQLRPVTERGARGNIVDALALQARDQAVTGAAPPAMLAVTSLRHLTPRQRRGRLAARAFLTRYSAQGRRRRATGSASEGRDQAGQKVLPDTRRVPYQVVGQDRHGRSWTAAGHSCGPYRVGRRFGQGGVHRARHLSTIQEHRHGGGEQCGPRPRSGRSASRHAVGRADADRGGRAAFSTETRQITEYALIHRMPSGADVARRLPVTARSARSFSCVPLEDSGRSFLSCKRGCWSSWLQRSGYPAILWS
jgi:hypothetical protein